MPAGGRDDEATREELLAGPLVTAEDGSIMCGRRGSISVPSSEGTDSPNSSLLSLLVNALLAFDPEDGAGSKYVYVVSGDKKGSRGLLQLGQAQTTVKHGKSLLSAFGPTI